jgi:hypothetical protein
MSVGAILRFLGWLTPSSFSLSLASRFAPATLFAVLRGVSGGVVMGTPVTFAEFVAAMLGMLLTNSVGLFTTVDACVTIDDVELERAGEDGRALLTKDAAGGGDGAANELAELR